MIRHSVETNTSQLGAYDYPEHTHIYVVNHGSFSYRKQINTHMTTSRVRKNPLPANT